MFEFSDGVVIHNQIVRTPFGINNTIEKLELELRTGLLGNDPVLKKIVWAYVRRVVKRRIDNESVENDREVSVGIDGGFRHARMVACLLFGLGHGMLVACFLVGRQTPQIILTENSRSAIIHSLRSGHRVYYHSRLFRKPDQGVLIWSSHRCSVVSSVLGRTPTRNMIFAKNSRAAIVRWKVGSKTAIMIGSSASPTIGF